MANYIVYCPNDCEINGKKIAAGTIRRTGICSAGAIAQQAVYPGEVTLEGTANDVTQKIAEGKVVDKTPAELKKNEPPSPSKEDRPILVTERQWRQLQERLAAVESKR